MVLRLWILIFKAFLFLNHSLQVNLFMCVFVSIFHVTGFLGYVFIFQTQARKQNYRQGITGGWEGLGAISI